MESDDCVLVTVENASAGTDTSGKSRQRSSPVTPLSANAKRLIQARLPFKPLHVEQCAGDAVTVSKKRKLIDSNSNFQDSKSLKKHDTTTDKVNDSFSDCVILEDMPSSPISDPIVESKKNENSVVPEDTPRILSATYSEPVDQSNIENGVTLMKDTPQIPPSTSTEPVIQSEIDKEVETENANPVPSSTNSEPVVESENHNLVVLVEDNQVLSSPTCVTVIKAKSDTVKLSVVEKEARDKQRAMEKEKREKERKEKEDAKLKKLQERQEKEKEREREKAEKEKEKAEKEKERAERKKQKEDERLRKQEQMLEEKKKKEEAKLEEKKKKEEKKEKPEDKVGVKEKELMQKFFVKSMKDLAVAKTPSVSRLFLVVLNQERVKRDAKSGPFMQFQIKENMKLAPVIRLEPESQLQAVANLDKVFSDETSIYNRSQLYISQLHDINYHRKTCPSTWPSCSRHVDDDVVVMKPNQETAGCFMHAKLFQFHDNYRPAYYGTWRKKSREIRARNPWSLDKKLLDYEVDSDEEWEEEEPGESLSHSEHDDEEEDEPEPDEDSDGFFVPHGYLSDGEGCAGDDDEDAEKTSPDKLVARQLAKARNWENEIRCKKSEVLHPLVIEICWWAPDATSTDPLYNKLREYQVQVFQQTPISTASKSNVLVKFKKTDKTKSKNNWISMPDSAMFDLVRLVHGNEWSIKKLTREFCEFWRRANQPQSDAGNVSETPCHLSKRKVEAKIRQIAVYESRPEYPRRKLWYINKETLEKLQMSTLPVPTEWKWLTKAVISSS